MTPAGKRTQPRECVEVRAERFVLVDGKGTPRGCLTYEGEGEDGILSLAFVKGQGKDQHLGTVLSLDKEGGVSVVRHNGENFEPTYMTARLDGARPPIAGGLPLWVKDVFNICVRGNGVWDEYAPASDDPAEWTLAAIRFLTEWTQPMLENAMKRGRPE